MRKAGVAFTLDEFGTHFRAATPICDRLLRAGVRGRAFESVRSLRLQLWPGCRRRLYDIQEQNRLMIEVICDLQHKKVFERLAGGCNQSYGYE